MEVKNGQIKGCCEDCAFYNDCPYNYFCPAAEVLKFFIDEQKAGRLKILMTEELQKELEDEEE